MESAQTASPRKQLRRANSRQIPCRLPKPTSTVNAFTKTACASHKHLLGRPSSPLHQILDFALRNEQFVRCWTHGQREKIPSAPCTVVLVSASFTFRRRFFSMPSTAKTCSPTAGRSILKLSPVLPSGFTRQIFGAMLSVPVRLRVLPPPWPEMNSFLTPPFSLVFVSMFTMGTGEARCWCCYYRK